MAPSAAELGLIVGDCVNLSKSGAENLGERFDMGTEEGDIARVIDGGGFVTDSQHIRLRVYPEKAIVEVVVNKNDDLFEDSGK